MQQSLSSRLPARLMRLGLISAMALFSTLPLGGCEKEKQAVQEKRKEVANEVGGAPKRTIDNVTNRVNASIKKGVDRMGENSGVEIK